MSVSAAQLRAFAAARSLGRRGGLQEALDRLGYVQADPIRAPARAQDLILMQRVRAYRAGDLERRYPRLNAEEETLHNYGFVPREVQALLYPRPPRDVRIDRDAPGLTAEVLAWAQGQREVHPRDAEAQFGRVRTGNAWGGTSSATTRALEALQYRGELRVARRERGVRVYAPATHIRALQGAPPDPAGQAVGLLRLLLGLYAPVSTTSLRYLLSLSGYGAPHLLREMRAALKDLPVGRGVVDGVTYLWPENEAPEADVPARARLLAPFDPVVWDRRRFEHLHGWAYRFEAYTPPAKRTFGYYALPLLWGDRAVGWANLTVQQGTLSAQVGYVLRPGRPQALRRSLEAELERYRAFLGARDLHLTVE